MQAQYTQIFIRGAKAGQRVYALFLGDKKRCFVMHVDKHAFAAISGALQGPPPPRPDTHRLLRDVLRGFDATLERAVIHSVKDNVFHARLILQMKNEVARKVVELDARPSDAIALALLTDSPVYCALSVMNSLPDMTDTLKKIQPKNG